MEKRCVITGLGAVTPLGNTVDSFWDGIKNGVCGIDYIKKFDISEFKVKIAAEVKDFNPELYMSKKDVKRNDLFAIYGMAAGVQAFEDSGIDMEKEDADRVGVIVGSGVGGLMTMEEQVRRMDAKGPSRVSPMFITMTIGNMVAGNIAIRIGAKGVCEDIVTACATGNNCIGTAFRNIKHGYLDVCVAGGAEGSICEVGVAGFTNLTALTTEEDPKKACRPFDKERNGFVMGDGAGILVLEELEHAVARGARIYGEIVGYGASCDAYHVTLPDPEGRGGAKAMQLAMKEAGIAPEQVDYINAHGTSTPANDVGETKAIKLALGEEAAKKTAISSTKSMTGHLLGAAGAIEAICCVKALQEGFLPPTINYHTPDEECDLDYIPNQGREAKDAVYALSNSLGFGGHNAVLCFKKWEGK
ncbi:beta-ketoacyl-[acyl-carrier-protein] synthase II [bacterium 1xD8-6]|nr:beta-ketoacyl-[acyl-carrier-protein] synthase II [bacterium D16-36]RKI70741.1 beta-ketoacyl-[acyl-carrier-protein] synthase II [bacterium 1xD8-6]